MPRAKACSCCKKEKPIEDFGRNRAAPDGLNYYCKVCARSKQRMWEKRNPDKVKTVRENYVKRLHAKNAAGDPYA